MSNIQETIPVKSNLILTLRERGKIMARREGHNIWLATGREFIAQLIAYASLSPDTPIRNDRLKYMGVGIGGTAQRQLSHANSAPISPPYTGNNAQTDSNPLVTTLERPVRISGSSSAYPGLAGDQWIGAVQAPTTGTGGDRVFRRVFTAEEVSYSPFLSVPLSEVMLFTSAADPENFQNVGMGYDTFDTLSKTAANNLEIVWTIRIG
jgi:hypothetical protein